MKARKKRYSTLTKALNTGYLVHIRCRADRRWSYEGYIVGLTDRFVMIQNATEEVFLNGYTVFPLREIRTVKSRPDFFVHRALQLAEIYPSVPSGIDLNDWSSLLSAADAYFPLVTLHTERRSPRACYIGRVADLKKRSVQLREIDPDAYWREETRSYRFRDITRVDFGGRYEAALWQVAQLDNVASDLS